MVGSASACNSGSYKDRYSLDLEKSANTSTYDHVGQVIEYTYTVKNTGDNEIKGTIYITDDKIPDLIIRIDDNLAKGAKVKKTASYVIKNTDLNNYKVTNTATASTTVYRQTI